MLTHETLLQCVSVSLCLHIAGCYGVDPASVSKEWKCARCKANAMSEVSEHIMHSCLVTASFGVQ